MNPVYIEQHYALTLGMFEGYWAMTFKHPYNRQEAVSVYVKGPSSHEFNRPTDGKQIVEPGPRFAEVLSKLVPTIEAYPYRWALDGKKIVSYGYDFESDFNGENLNTIELTEIAFKQVLEDLKMFSPIEPGIVAEEDMVSGKGVMAKMKVTFDKPKRVNQLAIDYFTEYPMELMTLMYQEDEAKDATLYEIPLQGLKQSNTSTYLHFEPVFAKVFQLIVRQETYSMINQSADEAAEQKVSEWEAASERSRELYEVAVDEYTRNLFVPRSGIELHEEVMESYKTSNRQNRNTEGSLNRYRKDFKEKKKRLDIEQR